jgi:hypothetical protein
MFFESFSPIYLVLCIVSRSLDFLSTYIATPTMKMEANILAKRLGWKKMILLNIMLCIIASFSLPLTVIICTVSLLVSGHNMSRGLTTRGIGEEKTREIMDKALQNLSVGIILLFTLSYASVYVIIGIFIIMTALVTLVQWVGYGFILFGFAIALHSNIAVLCRKRQLSRRKDQGEHDT